jgi:hypothetical protein
MRVLESAAAEMTWVRLTAVTVIVWIGVVVAGSTAPATAMADPADDPCGLAVSLLCRFVPVAPELDGDVDLTKQQPPADPADPAPDALPSAELCAGGCI